MRGIQWHPRVQISVGKRAPHPPHPDDANPNAAESIVKTRTAPRKLNLVTYSHLARQDGAGTHLQCLDGMYSANR
jgi:hypothetical protein